MNKCLLGRRCAFSSFFLLILLSIVIICILLVEVACDGTDPQNGGTSPDETENQYAASDHEQKRKESAEAKRRLLDENADWGSFYDPKDIFCGKFDCYKILGFDHETFRIKKPDTKEITKSYRALSRAWHPDKNKRKGAKERFVKIARAYEVLTDKDKRDEYDFLRDRPDEYFEKYGSSVLWYYAPKSDARLIVVLLLAFFSWVSMHVKKSRWNHVANKIVKAAVDNLGLREGGSRESIEIRKRALEIQAERQAKAKGVDNADANGKKGKSGKKSKQTEKEKRRANQDELRMIIEELVHEIDDFGGGYSKPTLWDMFVIRLVIFPWEVTKWIWWWFRYFVRRRRGLDYSDEELEYLTRRAVGEAAWDCVNAEEREDMKRRELWVQENLELWREELETQNLSPGHQKRYRRWKKKEGTKYE